MGVVQVISTLLIALGVLNDPTQNSKPYIPGISDRLAEKPQKTSCEVVAEEGVIKADSITTGVLNTEVKEEIKIEEQAVNEVEEVK